MTPSQKHSARVVCSREGVEGVQSSEAVADNKAHTQGQGELCQVSARAPPPFPPVSASPSFPPCLPPPLPPSPCVCLSPPHLPPLCVMSHLQHVQLWWCVPQPQVRLNVGVIQLRDKGVSPRLWGCVGGMGVMEGVCV